MSASKTQGGKWAGDASTNVFYYASLIDLKWKVFESVNPIHGVEPSHPVITTCSSLFHDNRLVTWHLGRSGLQLWVFFGRNESDSFDLNLNGLLKEVQQGSWDNGLPSDCLSHLYKAVHQHFERVFFKTGYVRVGRCFVRADGTFRQSFQVGFFIHGGHHLCASIELRERLQVHRLKKSNLDNIEKLKVVLMPIGIECKLTGSYLNVSRSPETLNDLEAVFPAYQIDQTDPVDCHRLFLVETVVSGHTLLYPASHCLIVTGQPEADSISSTLVRLNDESAGVVSSEGEVTRESVTADPRGPSQQATWKEEGFWTYKPPPENMTCGASHGGDPDKVLETRHGITGRARSSLQRKRLQRSAFRAQQERNKYRDSKSPVIHLPSLPIRTEKASTSGSSAIPVSSTSEPLPRLQPIVRNDLVPMSNTGPQFDAQPLTIECVENVACRDEATKIPGTDFTFPSSLYKIPLSTARPSLPMARYKPAPYLPAPRRPEGGPKREPPPQSTSPKKRVKLERAEQEQMIHMAQHQQPPLQPQQPSSSAGAPPVIKTEPSSNSLNQPVEYKSEREIVVNDRDLDKLFESDSADTSDDEHLMPSSRGGAASTGGIQPVPESCLTPDTLTDPKAILSPLGVPAHQFTTTQSHHDFPTPPSNDPSSYEEVVAPVEPDGPCDRSCDPFQSMLLERSSYAPLPLSRPGPPQLRYSKSKTLRKDTPPPSAASSASSSSSPAASSAEKTLDIAALLEEMSAELGELGSASPADRNHRTIKDEVSLQAIGDKIIANPDHAFTFSSDVPQASTTRELSDLPRLHGGQILVKFGDSLLNKFSVSVDDLCLPGGYSSLSCDTRTVLLDMSRMELSTQPEHKSTLGYLPKSSITIPVYHSQERPPPHNPSAFAAVQNSRFSGVFLKVLQQTLRSVVQPEEAEPEEETMRRKFCINTVSKLLETRLPQDLVKDTKLLTWKRFSALAEKFNTGGSENPLPGVVVGNEAQWITVNPLSAPFWLPKAVEPFAGRKDVAYVVVTPDNPHIINNITIFIKELAASYELHNLGQQTLLQTKLRNGVMRVGRKSADKTAAEPVDEWFVKAGDPESGSWQLYVRTCYVLLAKYLSKFLETDATAEHKNIVIYFIDPFRTKDNFKKAQIITRCFTAMTDELWTNQNTHFSMQCIPVDYVSDKHRNSLQMSHILRSLCFSVYNQATVRVKPKAFPTCLTGLGPISKDVVLEGGEQRLAKATPSHHLYTPAVVLEGGRPSKQDTLLCAYTLSHDNNWVIVALTDSCGHISDTAVYAVEGPTRHGSVPASVLSRIWAFCLNVVELYKCQWHLVISKMGIMSDFEDSFWTEKVKTVGGWNTRFQERCAECVLSDKIHSYGVSTVSIVSLLTSPHLHLLPLLNRPRSHALHTSSHVVLMPQQPPVTDATTSDRPRKDDNSFTFYSGPECRDRKRQILASGFLASSVPKFSVPKTMGEGKTSVFLGILHQHSVVKTTSKKHVLCADNPGHVLRFILRQFDALSWLCGTGSGTVGRLTGLPLHMFAVYRIYDALEKSTFVPP